MKKIVLLSIIVLLVIVGCQSAPTPTIEPTPVPPTLTATAMPPTQTAIPPTATIAPTSTSVPPTATRVPATATAVPTKVASSSASSSQNDWDPQTATPGVKMEWVEVPGRSTQNGKTIVPYKLVTSGLPESKTYVLWRHAAGKTPIQSIDGLTTNKDGKLIFANDKSLIENQAFEIGGFAKAEPLDVMLISTDQTVKAFAKVIPFPIEAKGPGNCHLWIELASDKGDKFIIYREGFEPGEVVTQTDWSEGETIVKKTTALADGTLGRLFELPAVIGKTSGSAWFSSVGKNCNLKVEYKWGAPAMEKQ